MTGEELRKKLANNDLIGKKIVFSQLADQIGITRQAFNSKLKAEKVDYWFVKSIADALDIDVAILTGERQVTNSDDEELKRVTEKALRLVEKKLSKENAVNLSDTDIELFTRTQQSLLRILKTFVNDNDATE